MQHNIIHTDIGKLNILTTNENLVGVFFNTDKHVNILATFSNKASKESSTLSKDIEKQLKSYIDGKSQSFDIPFRFDYGTELEKNVWECLAKIPYGETATYKKIAEEIGNVKAVRAVANAIGRNPISIIVPCHRVIGSDGNLRGYAGGLKIKQKLLELEEGINI